MIIKKLIQHNINLITIHTNLNINPYNINIILTKTINLKNISIINNQQNIYYKIQTYIPKNNIKPFKNKLNKNKLTQKNNYKYYFFKNKKKKQFKPINKTNPTIKQINKIKYINKIKIKFIINTYQKSKTKQLIKQYHPYKTPIFNFIKIKQTSLYKLNIITKINNQITLKNFTTNIKSKLNIPNIHFINKSNQKIKHITIINNSNIKYKYQTIQQNTNIFITNNIKHHNTLNTKIHNINLININHYNKYIIKKNLKTLLIN